MSHHAPPAPLGIRVVWYFIRVLFWTAMVLLCFNRIGGWQQAFQLLPILLMLGVAAWGVAFQDHLDAEYNPKYNNHVSPYNIWLGGNNHH